MVYQIMGISDIGIGVLLAWKGPEFLGDDAAIELTLLIIGIVLVVSGAGIWWFGRFRLGRRAAGDRASNVVDRG